MKNLTRTYAHGAAALALVFTGCVWLNPTDFQFSGPDGSVDAGPDGGGIDGAVADTGPDDAGPDDAGPDAGGADGGPPFDAGPFFDAGPDAGVPGDAGPDSGVPVDAGPDGGPLDSCVPLSVCPSDACGVIDAGCGATLTCGGCGAGRSCVSNSCECNPAVCVGRCGTVMDGCGNPFTCPGSCTAPETCGGGGSPNVCGCASQTCADLGASCGAPVDQCGTTLACGGCTSPQSCGAVTPFRCGCVPPVCGSTQECGAIPNPCGGVVTCGTCGAGEVCSDNECFSSVRNYAFVSPVAVPAAMGSLSGADSMCAGWAADAGLPSGTYRAILSVNGANAATRLAGARGWIRIDGRPVADLPGELFANGPLAPIRLDPGGADRGEREAWSASNFQGIYRNVGGASDCNAWTSASPSQTTWIGYTDKADEWLDRGTSGACSIPRHVYCFQVDHYSRVDVATFAETGRLMFPSVANFNTSSGLAGADAICQAEVTGTPFAGRPMRAFLATDSAPASVRFNNQNVPIIRPDGLRIANNLTALLNGPALHPPSVRVDGSSYTFRVFTGASRPDVPGSGGTTCNNWSTSTSGQAFIGFGGGSSSGSWNRAWFGAQTDNCASRSGSIPIYCLEE